ncbi:MULTISPECIES: hypothetical protein [unclassified Actinopolyspora]|uniref:hypothetical protein n=1 Tax=unclassified Actinopolyspora TaxID=2639451 RepID=UPI0013F59E73|nr:MULTISPECIES: hypothetical protein [unclassified Actinopolyspora]NHD16007.1 hypothetical protein [Actinopolyspora sp. BKK2]NHE74779.1 hypothetical protein [Actinopolyspora sp. BKK1]
MTSAGDDIEADHEKLRSTAEALSVFHLVLAAPDTSETGVGKRDRTLPGLQERGSST